MRRALLALAIVPLLSTCTAYRAQHGHAAPARSAPAAAAAAHEPETAPKPMAGAERAIAAAFDGANVSDRHMLLISEIDKYQKELTENGLYECCVTPACRQCAITAGECHCRHVIAADGPCCGECTQAWVEGRGNVPGVDREKVLEHLGCVRELYEKKTPEGMVPPGQRKDGAKSEEHKHH